MNSHIRTILWLTACVVFFWLARNSLTPFLLGGLLAAAALPFASRLERRGIGASLSALAVVGVVCLFALGAIVAIIPVAISETRALAERIPGFFVAFRNHVEPLLSEYGVLELLEKNGISPNFESVGADVSAALKGVLGWAAQVMTSGSGALFSFAAALLISPVVAFYLVADREAVRRFVFGLVPSEHSVFIERVAGHALTALSGWIRGQSKVCLAVGGTCAVGLWSVGVPGWLGLGVAAGALSAIPFIGFAFASILCLVAAALAGTSVFFMALAVLLVVQVLESFVFTPRLVGDELGLHPLATLFALMFLGEIFGFFGVLLALPLSSVAHAFVQEIQRRGEAA